MKKLLLCLLTLGLSLGLVTSSFATSTQVDSLIEKLVDKGILTKSEGVELKAEIASDEKMLREENMKQSLPEWVQKMKLKGDFRLRYQFEKRHLTTEERNRGRVRYRLGMEIEPVKDVKVGAGLASGGDDPRSTNQTLENSFQHPDIRLDYAYAEWAAAPWAKMAGGKLLRPDYLWAPTDLLWDSDINPEGGALHLEHNLFPNVDGFLNNGIYIIDENSTVDKADPFLYYTQGGLKYKNDMLDATVAGIYYNFNAVKGSCPNWSAGTNTGITAVTSTGGCTGALKFDYDSVGAAAEFGISRTADSEFPIERIAAFGDYIHNFDPEMGATGWAAGIKLGDKKVDNKGKWQLRYQYSWLGKDAFVDFTPDSDRIGGSTDTFGHEVVLSYGLNKNVHVDIDYYHDQKIKAAKNSNDVMQADLNVKF